MFVAYLKQNGGCDYTIGCGKMVIHIKGKNIEEAMQNLKCKILEEYDELTEAALFEVKTETCVPIKKWYRERDEHDQEEEAKEKLEAERVEYEKLKKKFEVES